MLNFLISLVGLGYVACSENQNKGFGTGKKFFYEKCLSCHNSKSSINNDSLSLIIMSKYDSLYLINKLNALDSDHTHAGFLKGVKYSETEIQSIYLFIKSYDKPVADNKPF